MKIYTKTTVVNVARNLQEIVLIIDRMWDSLYIKNNCKLEMINYKLFNHRFTQI